jgi:hypothetical protein
MYGLAKVCTIVASMALVILVLQQEAAPLLPGTTGPCQFKVDTISPNDLNIDIYYPADGCTAVFTAPYPAIAYAHGFSFFGLTDGAGDNAGNGAHLASWGYIVAIPALPDDAEVRIAELQWTVYEQPMVAGYQIYRRLSDQSYTDTPLASTGLRSSYLDTQVSGRQTYIYKLRSHDPAGNLHQETEEITVTLEGDRFQIWLPALLDH